MACAGGLEFNSEKPRPAVNLDSWREAALYAVIVLGAITYSFRLTSFLHAKEAVLHVGLVVCAVLAAIRGRTDCKRVSWLLPLALGLAWGAVSGLVVAQVKARVIEESIRYAALFALIAVNADLFADARRRARIMASLVISAVIVALLGLIQFFRVAPSLFPEFPGYDQRVYSVFGNQNLFGGYLAIAIPLLTAHIAADSRIRLLRYAALALLAMGLVLSESRTAWLATVAGMAVCVLWRGPHRKTTLYALAFMTLGLLCAALLTWPRPLERISQTLREDDVGGRARLWFWDGALRMIRDHPIAGVGLGNYAYFSPWYQGEALRGPRGPRHYHNELHTVHAHSEALELLAETGSPGLLCGLWFLMSLLRFRGRAWSGLAALLVFSCFNAPLHSAPHTLAGLLLAAMLFGKQAAAFPAAPRALSCAPWRWGHVLLAIALAAGFWWTVYAPSRLLRAAEDVHVAEGDPLALYARAIAHPWPNAQAHEEYGMALLDAGRADEAYTQLLKAREGLDTGRLYLLLGSAALQRSDKDAARLWLAASLDRWPANAAAWRMLWALTPVEDRAPLAEHATRWGIEESTAVTGECAE